jgi:Flp pilus assembly protein TadG
MSERARGVSQFSAETSGAAAVEFVIWLTILIVPLLSAVDVALYAFQRMQVQLAAQAGVQYVFHNCDPNKGGVPAFDSTKCSNLTLANITKAAQSTSLGSDVSLAASGGVGAVQEGYACTKANNTLIWVGTVSTAIGTAPTKPTPFTCVAAINPSTASPGDYVAVSVSYAYAPAFSPLSIGSVLTTPITETAFMRIDGGS